MNDLIRVKNVPVERYQNGNIKSYCSHITHLGLEKTVTVKHKNSIEFKRRCNECIEHLKNEYLAVIRNKYVNEFYEHTSSLAKLSKSNTFNGNELYKELHLPEVDFNEPKLSEDIKNFNLNRKPDYDIDYRVNLNIVWVILFPLYFIRVIIQRGKYNGDEQIYEDQKRKYEEYQTRLKQYKEEKIQYDNKCNIIKQETNEYNNSINALLDKYKNGERSSIDEYIRMALPYKSNSYMRIGEELKFTTEYSLEDNTLVIDLTFPGESKFPKETNYKYIKTRNEITSKVIKQSELNRKIMNAYYNIYLAVLNDLFEIDKENVFKTIILNGYYEGIDTRVGQEFRVCIMTSKVSKKKFEQVNLEYVNPSDCFKFLKGKGKPNPGAIIKVEPIRFINKEDYKLINNGTVLDQLSVDTNLAAMDWRDFETLIKDVFEIEFGNQIEIKNTQYSNDGGIDVVAFNNNPYSGGVILLQAKRYTNTVPPEPVRALRGSMEEKKAIRGIMVTTSSYGKVSYDYAMKHNITLINGNDLVQLLAKHGYDFHIDMAQAKAYKGNKLI